jgi:hypothetical protein
MMNWKAFGRKRLWPNRGKYYPGTYLEGLIKTTKNLSHDSHCPGRDSNPAPPKYLSKVFPLCHPIGVNNYLTYNSEEKSNE